jgi:hypothetical protein
MYFVALLMSVPPVWLYSRKQCSRRTCGVGTSQHGEGLGCIASETSNDGVREDIVEARQGNELGGKAMWYIAEME